MRGKTLGPAQGRKSLGVAGIGATVIVALALSGCSAGNLTGFDFPTFGLLKKERKDDDKVETAGAPPESRKLDIQ